MTVSEAGKLGGLALKGRFTGERNANHRLTMAQVRRIRERLAAGETKAQLAREYPVSETNLRRIERREIWKDA